LLHPQTFHWPDISAILALIVLEGLLSGDNALVLAIIARRLPPEMRKRALLYGVVGAFVLRLAAILTASLIMRLWWIQLVGGLYLVWITAHHFWRSASSAERKAPTPKGFWPTVLTIEIVDFAFAVDSVLAGVGFIGGRMDKVWVVWFGAVIGILLLRIASGFFIRLLERYPALDHIAYVFVGWVGIKLFMLSGHTAHLAKVLPTPFPEMPEQLFWVGMGVAFLAGGGVILWQSRQEKLAIPAAEEAQIEEMAEEFEETLDPD
jgi:YkoY family integral membrane protein